MSIVTLRASAPTGFTAVLPANADVDFNRRWAACIAGAGAIAAAIVYGLLSA